MAISQKRYIDITSGVGGQIIASERELIARVLTTNILAPYGSVMEFTSLDSVGQHFGTTSGEYKFADRYFGFISKDISSPKKISFARFASTALAPQLISTIIPKSISQFNTIESGSIYINLGGVSAKLTDIDLSSATTLADVASAMQTAIRAYTTGGTPWTAATVEYAVNATTGVGQFILSGGDTGTGESIDYAQSADESNLAELLGWRSADLPVCSQGANIETAASAMTRVADISNNFGSFAFLSPLGADDAAAVAAWNSAANFTYLYSAPVTSDNYSTIQDAVKDMDGTMLTLDPGNTNAEWMPMALLASTNYNRTNASRNYMFQQFEGVEASVTTDAMADLYDGLKINYYGATQSAGKKIAFYQRGVLQGKTEDAGVFCNEMWLKDAMIVAFFNLLLSVNKVPANQDGLDMTRGVMMPVLDRAINNGTILKLKHLTPQNKVYIYSLTNDPDAWIDVYQNGYKLILNLGTQTVNGTTSYTIEYLLVYAKGDSIKKVVGTHVLI